MHHLRVSIVGLVAALVALFAIESVVQSTVDVMSTPIGVHFAIAALVGVLLTTRLALYVPATALVTGVGVGYVGMLAFASSTDAAFTGVAAVVVAAEIGVASLAVLLAVEVAKGLHQFEDSIVNITLDEMPGVMTLASASDDIAIEMSRARRHERPLTVTVLAFDPNAVHASLHEIVRDVQQRMMQRYIMSGLARVAAQTTRRGDIVVQDPAANRVIVVSPESSPEQLDALKQRLNDSAYRTLGIPVRFGTAGFPTTALTFEDLVAHASGNAESPSIPAQERRPRVRPATAPDLAPQSAVRSLYREVDAPIPASQHLSDPVHAIHGD